MTRTVYSPDVLNTIPSDFFRECFSYSPSEGGLFWSPFRPKSHFPNESSWRGFMTSKANKKAGVANTQGYVRIGFSLAGQLYGASEQYLVWRIFDRVYDLELVLDHINGFREDNRIENLRQIPQAQNCMNRKKNKNNRSGHTGVSRNACMWMAQIHIDGKLTSLGTFKKKADAIAARQEAERLHYGEFARPDFLR